MSSNGKEAIESIVMFMRKFQLLREYIRRLLENDEEVKDDLITEPDEIEEKEDEVDRIWDVLNSLSARLNKLYGTM